jgi:hypothetical protein
MCQQPIDEFEPEYKTGICGKCKYKRGISSLEPMDLSIEDAKALDQALKDGTARPKIEIKAL